MNNLFNSRSASDVDKLPRGEMTGKELGARLDECVFCDREAGKLLLRHQTRAGEEAAVILSLIQNNR